MGKVRRFAAQDVIGAGGDHRAPIFAGRRRTAVDTPGMPAASAPFLRASERFLTRRQPGRALALLARTSVPVLAPDWIAARTPEPGIADAGADISPLVVDVDAAPAAPGGVLGGAPVVVKDALDVRGVRTGLGLRDGGDLADTDATIVARIRAAGGWIRGKTKMTELGSDGVGALMHHDMPRNPRAPGYFPGGSSTGTAVAVASGLARYGLGSDGLGSVRIPAAYCGLVGLKPTHGRLPADGYRSPVATLDVAGPLARTAADCARLWQVIAGEPVVELTQHAPARVGVVRQLAAARASRAIQAAFARVLDTLGIEREPVDIAGADRCTFLGGMIGAVELVASPYAERELSPAGRMNVALGRAFAPRDAAGLLRQREALREATARALARTPILAMPTTAVPPPALSRALLAGDQDLMLLRALGAYTPLANLTGLPSIAVPAGVDDRGRPLSIMFVTTAGGEITLLRLALAIERAGLFTLPLS
jgi:Asp-tRNA(Asn)/Glu-tRNA(Gln) amidotransferase A subunit family amidase